MNLQSITNINVDFYDKKYILVNAKQLDKGSRFLLIACYNHGVFFPLDYANQSAYIRYKKADDYSVFNFCKIDSEGRILVELTEQMLAAAGICSADLVIVNKRIANVDEDTLEVVVENRMLNISEDALEVAVKDAEILSTMTFLIDVSEIATENSEIESSYEYNGLNEALVKANAEYEHVIKWARSYATGDGGVRYNEETDNAKYYCEQSSESASNADISESKAETSANNAANSETSAASSAHIALTNANSALNSASAASDSASIATTAATTAQNSMNTTVEKTAIAVESATNAESFYLQTKAITDGLNGAFLPAGTITYEELSALKDSGVVGIGYLYNISNNFTTDSTFQEGAGIAHDAGTNVYYTKDGTWACLAGATVVGVKGDKETMYRKGNVNITVENIGAISSDDIASVDEMKSYLGI